MVRIRLMRMGAKKRPFYRVVVADSHSPRDGRFIEIIGQYDPLTEPSTITVDEEKALDWLRKGAQPSGPALAVLKRAGVWPKYLAAKPKREKTARKRSSTGAAAPS